MPIRSMTGFAQVKGQIAGACSLSSRAGSQLGFNLSTQVGEPPFS